MIFLQVSLLSTILDISTNHSVAGFISVDDTTDTFPDGGLPSSLDLLDDSNIDTNLSAARPVSVDDLTVPSPPAVGMILLSVTPAGLNPVKDTTAALQALPVVLATVDDPPATSPDVTDIFIFYGEFKDNALGGVHLPTIFVHPRRHARHSVLFWLVAEFKFLAMRTMAVPSAFLLTMQDITKAEFSRYREKHKIVWP